MAHIHFAWELGGGLGHAGRLKPLAQEAVRRGHRVTMSLRDLVHTNALLHDVQVPRFQAPIWLHSVHGVPSPPASLAEILLTCGYLNADALHGLVIGWQHLLGTLKPDLLVADYAPTAMLAARVLGIRSAAIGIGFFIPPDVSPMPCLRDWESIQPGRLAHADAQMLGSINGVLQRLGGAPLQRAAQALHGDTPLALTWPELDHYGRDRLPAGQRWWGPSMAPTAGVPPVWPAGSGPRVFGYLKSTHPDHVALLNALVQRGCRTVCYLPDVALGAQPPVASKLISYATGPVDLALALPDCELCICHAGEATLAQALILGVPVLLLPTQAEQFLIARRVALTGAGINAAAMRRPVDYAAVIASMVGESSYRAAARGLATRYAYYTTQQHTTDLVEEFERLLT